MALEITDFRRWLVAHAGTFVGVTRRDDRCPLAKFVYEDTGEIWSIGLQTMVRRDGPLEVRAMPDWAIGFVIRLDEITKHRDVGRWVSAEECLSALEA